MSPDEVVKELDKLALRWANGDSFRGVLRDAFNLGFDDGCHQGYGDGYDDGYAAGCDEL